MDERLYTLDEVIKGIYSVSLDELCGDSRMYLTGAGFYAAERKALLRLRTDAPPDETRIRLLRNALTSIFGCADVALEFEENVKAAPAGLKEDVKAASVGLKEDVKAAPVGLKENDKAAPAVRPGKKAASSRSAKGVRKTSRERIRAGNFEKSMAGIDFEDGGYFEKNPNVICGAPISEKPVPISGLSSERFERATICGEVVTLNYRAIRNGEMEILDCGIYDGGGSIAVKLFIPAQYTKFVTPKIKKGDVLIVYGEIQYDAFEKETALFAVDICRRPGKAFEDNAAQRRVELHLHTQMSAMDAVAPVDKLVRRAAQYRHPAVAITDHGVVQAFPDAYDAGKRYKIKIIYGVEAYLDPEITEYDYAGRIVEAPQPANAGQPQPLSQPSSSPSANAGQPPPQQPPPQPSPPQPALKKVASSKKHAAGAKHKLYHIILLAKNQTGVKNLYKLISKSHIDYFYRHPRMPRFEIEAHREGLIIGSACEAGELFTAVRENRTPDELRQIASFYDYLEIQPADNNRFLINENLVGSLDELRELNRRVVELGDECGKPVAATCDVHFADPGDEVFRRILMSGQSYHDADSQPPLYLRTTADMLNEFAYLGPDKAYEVVVKNTNLINSLVEDGIKPIPDGTFTPVIEGADDELRDIVWDNARKKYGDAIPDTVAARITQELDIIISKQFAVLYMIAHRLVKKSNDDGYFVGSRGSVGSSLVATLAGITEVNPLPPHYLCRGCRYVEFPDETGGATTGFDLPAKNCPVCGKELGQDGQDIMFEIFIGAKGSEKAPDIDLNFSSEYQLKAHKYTEELFGAGNVFKAGTIGTIANKTAFGFVKKYLESKGLTPGRIEEERLTEGCTGVKRTTGQHPGGIVVIPRDRDIYDFTPVQRPADATDTNIITTHFDFNSLHDTILKLDLLGHDDPSMIKALGDMTGVDPESIRMNDPHIMSLFNGTDALGVAPEEIGSPVGTIGLPEFGTRFIRQMLVETKPKNFADLLQISGLSHGTNVWLNNAQDLIGSGICTISEVIGTRESLVLYLMKKGVNQYTAFEIMEAVRKKSGVVSEAFENHMREKGVPDWYIESCKKIEYLFPKAHATAYVMMACRQAWYKINRPMEFYAAYFSIRADEFDAETMTRGAEKAKMRLADLNRQGRDINPREQKIQTILEVVVEMYARGISFLPVDLYRSDAVRFTIEQNNIRPPLESLSGLGVTAAMSICSARAGKPFISVEDMAARARLTKTVVEILRGYGALAGMANESQMSLFELL